MPLPININNRDSAYGYIDEVLGAPPPRLVRYGSALLLGVIIMVITISGFITYADEITMPATLQGPSQAEVITPAEKTVLLQIMVKNGDTVLPGAVLAVLRLKNRNDTLTASIGGEITLLRDAAGNNPLEPGTPLFAIHNEASDDYHVKIEVPEQLAARIAISQEAVVSLTRFPQADFGVLRATIISLPYSRPGLKELVADARLTHGLTSTNGRKLLPGVQSSALVSVIVGRKSLLRSLLHF